MTKSIGTTELAVVEGLVEQLTPEDKTRLDACVKAIHSQVADNGTVGCLALAYLVAQINAA